MLKFFIEIQTLGKTGNQKESFYTFTTNVSFIFLEKSKVLIRNLKFQQI